MRDARGCTDRTHVAFTCNVFGLYCLLVLVLVLVLVLGILMMLTLLLAHGQIQMPVGVQ